MDAAMPRFTSGVRAKERWSDRMWVERGRKRKWCRKEREVE